MTPAGLRLDQAPPIAVPLRFFLTAPAFAALAGLVLLWQGPAAFDSRWSPAALAATHLLTLGFAAMAMFGAMLQILPVLAGTPVARPRAVAFWVHAGLTLGTLALAGGFLFADARLLQSGAALLALAVAAFLVAVAASLARVRFVNEPVKMLRGVALALAVTATLGVWLAASRGWGFALPDATLRDLHPAWGFLGWTAILVAGVAYRVVPMFQMTPAYPAWMSHRFGRAVLLALGVWSVALLARAEALAALAACVLAALVASFALLTLRLLHRRRRRLPEVGLLFWRAGLLCALTAAALWVAMPLANANADWTPVLIGVLALAGAIMSIISGMLYRIAPFLSWFHLQARSGMGRHAPHVRQYLAEQRQRLHFWLHAAAVVLLVAAAFAPQAFARVAGLALVASALQLTRNLLAIVGTYRAHLDGADLSRSG